MRNDDIILVFKGVAEMTTSDSRVIDANNLCKNCGICCDGTLFGHVIIPPSDVLKTKKIGIPFRKNSNQDFVFDLCCPRFVDCSCEVYLQRPHACMVYFCKLQKDVEKGTIGYEDGLKIVTMVKAYTQWVCSTLVFESASNTQAMNYRKVLSDYHSIATLKHSRGELCEADVLNIKKIFEQLRLMDYFFQGTDFLKVYEELIQSIEK